MLLQFKVKTINRFNFYILFTRRKLLEVQSNVLTHSCNNNRNESLSLFSYANDRAMYRFNLFFICCFPCLCFYLFFIQKFLTKLPLPQILEKKNHFVSNIYYVETFEWAQNVTFCVNIRCRCNMLLNGTCISLTVSYFPPI